MTAEAFNRNTSHLSETGIIGDDCCHFEARNIFTYALLMKEQTKRMQGAPVPPSLMAAVKVLANIMRCPSELGSSPGTKSSQ